MPSGQNILINRHTYLHPHSLLLFTFVNGSSLLKLGLPIQALLFAHGSKTFLV